MEYDYIKHTVTQLGKTCKRLKDYYDLVTSDITITPSVILITIEVATDKNHLDNNGLKRSTSISIYLFYIDDTLTEYMYKLKRRLNRAENDFKEWWRNLYGVFEHSDKDINNIYGKSVTEDNNA